MGKRKKSTRISGRRQSRGSRNLSIFLSYATEDRALAGVVESRLKQIFAYAPVIIFRDIRIREGDDYREDIEKNLDDADIMIVLLTDRLKASYAYPGFELGYFKRSIQARKFICPGLERFVIPFCIGSEIPDTVHYIQGIKINKKDIYSISNDRINAKFENQSEQVESVYRLFDRIGRIVSRVSKTKLLDDSSDRIIKLKMHDTASDLYKDVIQYLQGRVASETFPERKIVIRCEKGLTASDPSLEASRVELVGKSFEVFGMKEDEIREYSWQEFMTRVPAQFSQKWSDGIHSLVKAVLDGSSENYMIVTTSENQSFRLFVSRIMTYYSGETEIHIYIVLMISATYGDQITARLTTAIDTGLKFRALMHETESKFLPDDLAFPTMDSVRLKPRILQMLSRLELILRESKSADLGDPRLLRLIWGKDAVTDVQTMMKEWSECFNELSVTAHDVLAANEESFEREKSKFISSLRKFDEKTVGMNRRYTTGVLKALEHIVGDTD